MKFIKLLFALVAMSAFNANAIAIVEETFTNPITGQIIFSTDTSDPGPSGSVRITEHSFCSVECPLFFDVNNLSNTDIIAFAISTNNSDPASLDLSMFALPGWNTAYVSSQNWGNAQNPLYNESLFSFFNSGFSALFGGDLAAYVFTFDPQALDPQGQGSAITPDSIVTDSFGVGFGNLNSHILVIGQTQNGQNQFKTVFASNVPEPSTLAILALGLLGFTVRRKVR